jgi:hypothetical protein
MHPGDVGEAEALHRVLDEAQFLGGGVDERELPLPVHQRERQARKARTGADVRDALTSQVGMHREAVEQVMRDHGRRLGDRGQVDALVPLGKIRAQRQQTGGILTRQRDAQA